MIEQMIRLDIDDAMEHGVLVDLVIRRCRRKVAPDLTSVGIDVQGLADHSAAMRGAVSRPASVLPKAIDAQLKSIETQARQNLERCSYDCSSVSMQGKFVPEGAYHDFKVRNTELRERYEKVCAGALASYPQIVEALMRGYATLADKVRSQCEASGYRLPARFRERFVEGMRSCIPSADDVRDACSYSTFLRRPGGKSRAMDGWPRELVDDLTQSEIARERAMHDWFAMDVYARYHTEAARRARSVIESMDKNAGRLVGRASIQAHGLVGFIRKMDFYGDATLPALADDLEGALDNESSPRDPAAVRATTFAIAASAEKEVRRVLAADREPAPSYRPRKSTIERAQAVATGIPRKKTVKVRTKKSRPRRHVKR